MLIDINLCRHAEVGPMFSNVYIILEVDMKFLVQVISDVNRFRFGKNRKIVRSALDRTPA